MCIFQVWMAIVWFQNGDIPGLAWSPSPGAGRFFRMNSKLTVLTVNLLISLLKQNAYAPALTGWILWYPSSLPSKYNFCQMVWPWYFTYTRDNQRNSLSQQKLTFQPLSWVWSPLVPGQEVGKHAYDTLRTLTSISRRPPSWTPHRTSTSSPTFKFSEKHSSVFGSTFIVKAIPLTTKLATSRTPMSDFIILINAKKATKPKHSILSVSCSP